MEYEIEQSGEHALFDESTNPSLIGGADDEPLFFRRPNKRTPQKGELIPEEEDQLS